MRGDLDRLLRWSVGLGAAWRWRGAAGGSPRGERGERQGLQACPVVYHLSCQGRLY